MTLREHERDNEGDEDERILLARQSTIEYRASFTCDKMQGKARQVAGQYRKNNITKGFVSFGFWPKQL